jgi:hypothetical protein
MKLALEDTYLVTEDDQLDVLVHAAVLERDQAARRRRGPVGARQDTAEPEVHVRKDHGRS